MSPGDADLDRFLDRLADAGYSVGVRERLLAHSLLQRLATDGKLPPSREEQLRKLEPLLSRTPDEQKRFVEVIADYLESSVDPIPILPPSWWRRLWSRVDAALRPRWVIALVLVGIGLGVAYWVQHDREPRLVLPPGFSRRLPVIDSTANDTSTLASVPSTPVYVPAAAFPELPVRRPHTAALRALRWGLSGLAVLLMATLVAWVARLLLRDAHLHGVRTDEELEMHVLRDPGAQAPAAGREVRRVSRIFRQRVAGAREELDLRASLQATVRAGGALAPRYRPVHQTPEYLALVERVSAGDHQAAFHSSLVDALRAMGVAVDLYHYDGSPGGGAWRPGTAHRERGGALSFAHLSNRYAGHRLLVVGNPEAAFNPVTGHPAAWTRHAAVFPQRAWFSPLPVPSWGAGEEGVDRLGFLVLPALPEALETAAEWFATDRANLRARRDWPGAFPPSLRGAAVPWVTRPVAPPAADLERLVLELREHLGPLRFQWLCACAVFPSISWPLTMALGRAVLTPRHQPLDPDTLARGAAVLGTLPWMRYGRMPDWLRHTLLDRLAPAQEAQVRAVIEERLSVAIEGQDGARLADVGVRKRMAAWLARRGETARDVVLAGFLERKLSSRLAQRIPAALRRLLFTDGHPVYGIRGAVPWATAVALALCVAAVVQPLWGWWTHAAGLRSEPEAVSYAVFELYSGAVSAAAFSPDGRTVAMGSDSGRVFLWPAGGRGETRELRGQRSRITHVALNSSGRIVAAAASNSIHFWSTDAQSSHVIGIPASVTALAFSPTGDLLAIGSSDGMTRILSISLPTNSGAIAVRVIGVGQGGTRPITFVAFSPDAQRFATLTADGMADMYFMRSSDPALTNVLPAGLVNYVGFSPGGRELVLATHKGISSASRTWSTWQTSGEFQQFQIPVRDEDIQFVAFGPSRQIVTISQDGRARLWRLSDTASAPSPVLLGNGRSAKLAVFSPDGLRAVTAYSDGTVHLWGRPPGAPVNIASCPGAGGNAGPKRLANWLASIRAGSIPLFSAAVYDAAAWDSAQLGRRPGPGMITYRTGDPAAETSARVIRARLAGDPTLRAFDGSALRASSPVAVNPCVTAAASTVQPRIRLYYKAAGDSLVARRVQAQLLESGYTVEWFGLRPNATFTTQEPVRYFHPEDKRLAGEVQRELERYLRESGVVGYKVRIGNRVGEPTPGEPNSVEVWVPSLAEWRLAVRAQVFARTEAGQRIEATLRDLGFRVARGGPNPDVPDTTRANALWVGPDVPLEMVRSTALQLTRAGIQLRLVSTFYPRRSDRNLLIQVGSLREGEQYGPTRLRDRPYSIQEIRAAYRFPLP